MRAQSGEHTDHRALEQPCAGHKVELPDKVEWNQVKLEYHNKLQVKLKCPGKLKRDEAHFRRSRFPDVEIEQVTANTVEFKNQEDM